MSGLLFHPDLIKGDLATACPACHGSELQSLGDVPQAFHFCSFIYRHPINCAKLMACGTCDFHFKNPCLSLAILDDLYRRQPATVWGSTVEGREDVAEIISVLEQMERRDIRILDVGCYTGALLHALAEHFQTRKNLLLHGVEPSGEAAAQAATHGIRILGSSIADLDAFSRFDIILLTDVFEHILHSKDFLQTLSGLLSPGGQLVVMTGAFDSGPFSKHRSTFHYCAMPEHLAFISRKHSDWLARQLELELVEYKLISHASRAPSRIKSLAKSLIYWAGRGIPASWLSGDLPVVREFARLRGMGVQNLTGQPDHAFVVFRRPTDAA